LPFYSRFMAFAIEISDIALQRWLETLLPHYCPVMTEDGEAAYVIKGQDRIVTLYHGEKNSLESLKSWHLPLRAGQFLDDIHDIVAMEKMKCDQKPIRIQSYVLYPFSLSLQKNGDGRISLTEKERDILVNLYQQRGKTVLRRDLLDKIWGYHEQAETHTLETHIYRLRRKIEADPSQPRILCTNADGYYLKL